MAKLIDLTRMIEDNMPVYPGDMETRLVQTKYLDIDKYNSHRLDIGLHSGTHIDSSMHLIDGGKSISQIPLESFIGEGSVINAKNESVITLQEKHKKKIISNGILLLYTGHEEKYGTEEYFYNTPLVDMGFAEYLISKKIKMLGIDSPSPDAYPFDIHKLLFKNGILIIENLTNIHELLPHKRFEVIAFPLKINADSSVLRVVSRVI